MFSSRQTGPVYTSVRVRPIRLMILGIVAVMVGLVLVLGGKSLGALVAGAVLALVGARLSYIAGRQFCRGVRTFLS